LGGHCQEREGAKRQHSQKATRREVRASPGQKGNKRATKPLVEWELDKDKVIGEKKKQTLHEGGKRRNDLYRAAYDK